MAYNTCRSTNSTNTRLTTYNLPFSQRIVVIYCYHLVFYGQLCLRLFFFFCILKYIYKIGSEDRKKCSQKIKCKTYIAQKHVTNSQCTKINCTKPQKYFHVLFVIIRTLRVCFFVVGIFTCQESSLNAESSAPRVMLVNCYLNM